MNRSNLVIIFCTFFFLLPSQLSFADDIRRSFSCVNAQGLEHIICSDPDLSARDRTLAKLFNVAKYGPLNSTHSGEIDAQRKWLQERDKECAKDQSKVCLIGVYDDRLFDLAVSALFSDHDLAIAEITRQYPKLASIYEAIFVYLSDQVEKDKTNVIASLINSAFKETQIVPATDIEEMHLHIPSAQEPLYKKIPDAQTAASSDEAFGTFLYVVSTTGYGERTGGFILPCTALLRHPSSVTWMRPLGAGAIDGSSPTADCERTLPKLPKLTLLQDQADKAQPSCSGTIRFTLGAEHEAQFIEVLVDDIAPLSKDNQSTQSNKDEQIFIRNNKSLVDQTLHEMQEYYQNWFHASLDKAKHDAEIATNTVVNNAFRSCE